VDPAPGRLELSDLESLTVVDAAGAEVGELIDVVANLAAQPPRVCAFIIERDEAQLRASWEQLRAIDVDGKRLELGVDAAALEPATVRGEEIALVDAVLDNQILDVQHRRFVRVQDVILETSDDGIQLVGVDAGAGAVMRRMGLGFLSRSWRRRPGDFVPWDDVNLISVRLSRANFIEAFAEIAELHPADLADVISQVGPRERAAVLAALNAPLAADTLQEMDEELATGALSEMPRARAAAVVRHIDPDEAADLLDELPVDVAEEVLGLLPPETALALRGLASHPEHSAGALMTTEFVALPLGLSAGEALVRLRSERRDEAALAALFVVGDETRLAGTVSLAQLVLAAGEASLAELMDDDAVSVTTDVGDAEVGRLMTKYKLLVLPVTDESGAVVGAVTLDDALEALVPDEWKQRLPRFFG
jgi:magnesium transporter